VHALTPLSVNRGLRLTCALWRLLLHLVPCLHDSKYACRLRAIGVSNFEEQHLEELVSVAKFKPAVNQVLKGAVCHTCYLLSTEVAEHPHVLAVLQVECHPRLPQNELRAACHRLDIVVTAYSPFGAEGAACCS
jgi:diketogulonate reductase-like aldo/keto reductase